jgi:hypothetical protein
MHFYYNVGILGVLLMMTSGYDTNSPEEIDTES